MLHVFFSLTVKMEKLRVGFVGANQVGKTSVIYQYLTRTFLDDYEPTIEDFFQVQRNGFILEIFDFSGNVDGPECKFRQEGLKHCDVVVYMFSLADPKSLSPIHFFRNEHRSDLPFVLVGNKVDLNWRVCPQILRNIEYDLDTQFFPVSAKLPVNIDELFDRIIEKGKEKSPSKQASSEDCCIFL